MAVRVPRQGLEPILRLLPARLPYAAQMYGMVRSLLRGVPCGLQLWVDNVNQPQIFIISADETSCKNEYCKSLVNVYCIKTDKLAETIQSPGILNLDTTLFFRGVSAGTIAELEKAFPVGSFRADNVPGNTQYFYADSEKSIKDFCLPDEFYLGALDRFVSSKIAEVWKFCPRGISQMKLDEQCWGFPNVVVYECLSKLPIGWAVQNIDGIMGHLYVVEKYRKRGVAKFLTSRLARTIIRKDGFVVAEIMNNNEYSKTVTKFAGLKQVENCEFLCRMFKLT